MRKAHTHSQMTLVALTTFGTLIATARRERRWTVDELAERAGISPNTLRAAERGTPTVAIGVVFELATLLGVPLFGAEDSAHLTSIASSARERLALLPQRVRPPRSFDADF